MPAISPAVQNISYREIMSTHIEDLSTYGTGAILIPCKLVLEQLIANA